jgi:hypothetical protein
VKNDPHEKKREKHREKGESAKKKKKFPPQKSGKKSLIFLCETKCCET